MSARRWILAVAAGAVLLAGMAGSAAADVTYSGSCIASGGYFHGGVNCVIMKREGVGGFARVYRVEEPRGEALDEALARDRKWLARCKPVIRTDAHGVGRYHYAARGCEFGATDD